MISERPIPWTAREILEATRGELLGGDLNRQFAGVSIDSRNIAAGDFFVAIVGEVHDGHSYAPDVVRSGVRGVMIRKGNTGGLPITEWKNENICCIGVEDTTRALGDMAAFNRNRTDARVVAITGSNGKTTTRKLTSAVMSSHFDILSTVGNCNNLIGLPLTLLRLQHEHQWAVVELGTNSPGEIARLADICTADIGVITNIGPVHLEGLGSLDGVMREKGDLLNYLKPGGKAVLNADDHKIRNLAAETDKEVVLFGLSEGARVRAEMINETADAITFTLVLDEDQTSVVLNTSGQFMVANALAAAAVGFLAGLSIEELKIGLERFRPAWGRMNIMHLANDIHMIDDTYNANPVSMQAAINTLKTISGGSRMILVLGDMLELGHQSESLHKQIGAAAGGGGICKLFVTGEFAGAVAAGACDAQMSAGDVYSGSKDGIFEALKQTLKPGDWVLIKGSRGMAMEDVVKALIQWVGIES